MKIEESSNVSFNLKPAFDYVSDAVRGWGVPNIIDGAANLFADPKKILNDIQDNIAKNFSWLQRPNPQQKTPVRPQPEVPTNAPR